MFDKLSLVKCMFFKSEVSLLSNPIVKKILNKKLFHLVLQKSLIRVLEKYKFNIIPIKMRHIYTQGGGIHCATLDTVRDSKYESYF